jgi:hypothetical protein
MQFSLRDFDYITFSIDGNFYVLRTISALTNTCSTLSDTSLNGGGAAAVWASDSEIICHSLFLVMVE